MPRRPTTARPPQTVTRAARVAYDVFTLGLEDVDTLTAHLIARLEALRDDATEDDDEAEHAALVLIAEHLRDRQRRLTIAADVLREAGDPVGAPRATASRKKGSAEAVRPK